MKFEDPQITTSWIKYTPFLEAELSSTAQRRLCTYLNKLLLSWNVQLSYPSTQNSTLASYQTCIVIGEKVFSHFSEDHVIKSDESLREKAWPIFRISPPIYKSPWQDFDVQRTGSFNSYLSLLSKVGINAPMLSTDILLVYNRQYINLANTRDVKKNTIYITI
jgi:hypothetical protein